MMRRSKVLTIKNVLTQTLAQAMIAQESRHHGGGGGGGGGGYDDDGGDDPCCWQIHDLRVWDEQR